MLQKVDGLNVYVVDFDTMPQLPITGEGEEKRYAKALDNAIRTGIITEPGKYGIYFQTASSKEYTIYKIIE